MEQVGFSSVAPGGQLSLLLCWQLGCRGEVTVRTDQDRAELAVLGGHRDQQPAQVRLPVIVSG
jgi:hypothetical protein